MTNAGSWVRACAAGDIPRNDVKRFDHGGDSYAIFRSGDDRYYAISDICTHEHAHISDGYVEDSVVECPRHAGCFDFRTGKALGPPVSVDLETYEVKVEEGAVYLLL